MRLYVCILLMVLGCGPGGSPPPAGQPPPTRAAAQPPAPPPATPQALPSGQGVIDHPEKKPPSDLLHLIDAGAVRASVIDDVSMSHVVVEVQNPGKTEIGLTVPAGLLFRPKDPRYQDLIVVETLKATLAPESKAVLKVAVCCTDNNKWNPGGAYFMERLPEADRLRQRAAGLATSGIGRDNWQTAIWYTAHRLRYEKNP